MCSGNNNITFNYLSENAKRIFFLETHNGKYSWGGGVCLISQRDPEY